ncbi:SdpI family protein [Candidatus Woesearchaeota archaeon]|nr:SdpI family protein [Candidatus Woesearchaeota archaeon]
MAKSNFFKMSSNHAITLILVALIVASMALSVHFYNDMPDKMATHWDSHEVANGWTSKDVALFMFPTILGLLTVIFLLIPNIDPLKQNLLKFERQFGVFMILLSTFIIVIQAQVISWNKGIPISPSFITTIALGILFFYAGTLLKKSKRNYFIGIRTPWTLNSDYVWEKTHRVGSILFKIAAIIFIFSSLLKGITSWIIIITVFSLVIITMIYSYTLYIKEEKSKLEDKNIVSKKAHSKKRAIKKIK